MYYVSKKHNIPCGNYAVKLDNATTDEHKNAKKIKGNDNRNTQRVKSHSDTLGS